MHNHERTAEYLLEKLGALSMRPEARTGIRESIAAYADFHTVNTDLQVVISSSKQESFWGEISRWYAPMVGALMIALMTGTTYAAEKALPGDALYTVKVRVTEPVQIALSSGAEAKAKTHTALAERRLEEAEKLAVEKKLDVTTQVFLTEQFSKHVDSSLAAAETLKESGATVASLDARSSLEARLVAHEDILGQVEDHLEEAGEQAESARASAREIRQAVAVRQEVVRDTRIAIERDLEAVTNPTETLAAITKADVALPKVVAVAQTKPTTEPVVRRMADAEEALVEAKESIESDDPEDTRRAFRKAREASLSSEIATVLVNNSAVLTAVAKIGTISTTTLSATTTLATTTPSSTEATSSTSR